MKTILTSAILIALLWTPCVANQDRSVDVMGKWYRVVPGCSLLLEILPDGQCALERRWFDGNVDHSILTTAKWRFDGWCLVIDSVGDRQAEQAVEFPIRLSLIELKGGERVLGMSLSWDTHKENIQADVFHRGEFKYTPPTTPDKPTR